MKSEIGKKAEEIFKEMGSHERMLIQHKKGFRGRKQ